MAGVTHEKVGLLPLPRKRLDLPKESPWSLAIGILMGWRREFHVPDGIFRFMSWAATAAGTTCGLGI